MNTKDRANEQKHQLAARLLDAIEAAEFEEDVADFRAGVGESTIRIPSLDDIKARLRRPSPSFVEKHRVLRPGRISLAAILRPAWAASDVECDSADNAIMRTSYFDEKLIALSERDQEGDLRITFQSTDPEFADKFVRLVAPAKMWVLLSKEVSEPNGVAAILKFQLPLTVQNVDMDEAIDVYEAKGPLELKSLSAQFDSGEITADVIRLSIARLATKSGEEAWKEVAEKIQHTKLGAVISEALGKSNGGTT